jgi:PAS domain S-box-containing protein
MHTANLIILNWKALPVFKPSSFKKISSFIYLMLVFIADLIVPPGTAMGILYLFGLVLILGEEKKTVFLVSFLSSILIITDVALHFDSGLHYSVYWDRIFSLLAVWGTYYLLIAHEKVSREKVANDHELAMHEIKYRQLIENLIEGVQIIDHNWRYIYINDVSEKQSKFSKSELIGFTMMEKYPGIEKTPMFESLKNCMLSGNPKVMENEFIYPDGRKSWFQLSFQKIPEGVLVLSNEISDLIRAKEELIKQEMKREYMNELEEYKKENLESLRYARRLQRYLIHQPGELRECFPQSFIINNPKNHISGDFFWFNSNKEKTLLVVGDCTGHGIPGAMLTILGLTILHNIFTREKDYSPAMVLKLLDKNFHRKLSKRGTEKITDSMDVVLCEVDRKEMILRVSGANNPVYLVRNNEVQIIKTDKYYIGTGTPEKLFIQHELKIQSGDMVYCFSDGYADQFGGEKGKKFGSKRLRELLSSISHKEISEQEQLLQNTFSSWKNKEEQTDDVLLAAIKI